MAGPRRVLWHWAVASRWTASDREPACFVEPYSELGSLSRRPTAEAKAQARQRRQRLQHLPLRQQPRQAMIWHRQLETAVAEMGTAVEQQGPEPAARSSGSARQDWSPSPDWRRC